MDGILGLIIAAIVIGNVVRMLKKVALKSAANQKPLSGVPVPKGTPWTTPTPVATHPAAMRPNQPTAVPQSAAMRPNQPPARQEMKSAQPHTATAQPTLQARPVTYEGASILEGQPINRSSLEMGAPSHRHGAGFTQRYTVTESSMGRDSSEGDPLHDIMHTKAKKGRKLKRKQLKFSDNAVVNGVIFAEVLGKPGGIDR